MHKINFLAPFSRILHSVVDLQQVSYVTSPLLIIYYWAAVLQDTRISFVTRRDDSSNVVGRRLYSGFHLGEMFGP
jgi:hypothetical protein